MNRCLTRLLIIHHSSFIIPAMPELPEVESFTRYFAEHALHQRVARVEVRDPRILGEVRAEVLAGRVEGRTFTSVQRHGKHLFADTGGGWVRLHFGMTGDLAYYREGDDPRFARVIFHFDDGAKLAFEDMRLFGVVDLLEDPAAYIEKQRLGRDPLDASFRLKDFRELMRKRRGAIKALLMSQELVAGLGNLYVDELLFQTGIHPKRLAEKLSDGDIKTLFAAMRRILQTMIKGKPRRGWLFDRREEGERCSRCDGTLKRATIAGRTTYWCNKHQA
jgi:formamidopyrimidine-DNA glycosylase